MKPSPWSSLILIFAVAACWRVAAPATLPTGDAGTPAAGAAVVCAHLRTLGCPEGQPSKGGETCEALVTRVPYALPTQCVADSQDVDDARACGLTCGASQ